jgi:asparagine synthase (glutamine-hydrolysing)
MCGIAGVIDKKDISHASIQKMVRALKHRGSDGEGIAIYTSSHGHVALAQRRLAIIDLSSAGKQPMEDHSKKYSIVFNGEIYNYKKLRDELIRKGHTFTSQSDTEVILEGYKEFGEKIVEKLEGMFAFALYDKGSHTIIFARDHFGKKPLYYFVDDEMLIFASEIKALLMYPGIKKKLNIDWQAVEKYLMYGYIPSPHSIYREVKKLEPSTLLKIDLITLTLLKKYRFWHLENIAINNDISQSDAINTIDTLIHQAVEKRLLASDVPVGTFLSGGIDSSLITTIASEYSPGIETFSIVYDNSRFDESYYAKKVGKSLNIHQTLIHFKNSLAKSLLEEILFYMDEPFADASLLPTTFLSKHTGKKVTVSLSGDGGDEIFGGYAKYNAQLIAELLRKTTVTKAVALLAPLLSYFPMDESLREGMRKFATSISEDFHIRHFIWGSGSFTIDELQLLLKRFSGSNAIFSESKNYVKKWRQHDFGNALLYLDSKIQLPDWYLAKVDRASMSQSLEVRSPLLDKNLAEFAFSLPSDYKFNSRNNKILLKKYAKKYLPDEIINRKKMGFGLPLNQWMRTIFQKQIEDSFMYLPEELFQKTYINLLWKEFLSGEKDHGTKLWRLFLLGHWIKTYEN